MIAQYKVMVYMLCFTLPLVCGLPGTYIMPCALILLILKKGNINFWQIGMILFVAIMEVLASLWYPEPDIPKMVQYISFAGVMFFLIHDKTELDYQQCVKMYMFGISVLCGVILITGLMTAPSNWLQQFSKGYFRFGSTQMEELEGMKLTLNANSLAYYSITGMCCGALLIEGKQGKELARYVLLLILAAIVGFLTVSRSWLLVTALCLFLYVISKVKHPERFLGLVLILSVAAMVIIWILGKSEELATAFVERFNPDRIESDSHRGQIFMGYMRIFFSDIRIVLTGSGVACFRSVLGYAGAMHNGTQQILVCLGLFGFVIFMAGLCKPVLSLRRQGKREMVYWLPLIGVVMFVQTIQFLNPTMLMLPFIVGVYALKMKNFKPAETKSKI